MLVINAYMTTLSGAQYAKPQPEILSQNISEWYLNMSERSTVAED